MRPFLIPFDLVLAVHVLWFGIIGGFRLIHGLWFSAWASFLPF